VAFVVPRHGHAIVDRNRLQRRLREIARRDWLPGALEEDLRLDVVVRARAEAYGATFEELRASLSTGLENLPWDGASSSA
jgi:ribonuclease P protein component